MEVLIAESAFTSWRTDEPAQQPTRTIALIVSDLVSVLAVTMLVEATAPGTGLLSWVRRRVTSPVAGAVKVVVAVTL